jgi:hypothetical protein
MAAALARRPRVNVNAGGGAGTQTATLGGTVAGAGSNALRNRTIAQNAHTQ